MLEPEAIWFAEKLSDISVSAISPILNIGSSTEIFRIYDQPWIDRDLWRPLRERGATIVHMDAKDSNGVDIVGDLCDNQFLKSLSQMNFKTVFCNNLLEHVGNRREICQALSKIVDSGGYICVSCPFRYPYHPDPIDTMFRPNIQDLANQFLQMEVMHATIISSSKHRKPIALATQVLRLCMPFYRPKRWAFMLRFNSSFLFKDYEATCLVLKNNHR